MPKKLQRSKRQRSRRRRPRVLVLEGLGGSARCVRRAGGSPVSSSPLSLTGEVVGLIEGKEWDALLLTGGGDVDPRRYGFKKPHKHVYGVSTTRDEIETYALEFARERGLPVLGICRGCQIMTVEGGGTLWQHIGYAHSAAWHGVQATKGSLLHEAAGSGYFHVRSLHHQEVKVPAEGFEVVGRATQDGTVEAVASTDGRVLGVQFHPEMDTNAKYSRGIFRWLVTEAAQRAGLPTPMIPKEKPSRPKPSTPGWTKSGWTEWSPRTYSSERGVSAWTDGTNDDDYGLYGERLFEGDDEELTARSLIAAMEREDPVVPKRRTAGTRSFRSAPITTFFQCRCHAIKFDGGGDPVQAKKDRDDHEAAFGTGAQKQLTSESAASKAADLIVGEASRETAA